MRECEYIKEFQSCFSGKKDRSKELHVTCGEDHPFVIEEGGEEIGCAYLHYEPQMRPPMVWVMYLKSYHIGIGNGSKILKMLCDFADQKFVTLYLEPVPDPGSCRDRSEIVSWYRRYGFEGDHTMKREPNA